MRLVIKRLRSRASQLPRGLLALVCLAILLGLGHHVDHVLRGNHVGWPLTDEVNPFTFSLLAYPVVGLGVWLGWEDRSARLYWVIALLASTAFVGLTHFGPTAVEPPADIAGVYEARWLGLAALGWLGALLLVLAGGGVYAATRWWRAHSDQPGS